MCCKTVLAIEQYVGHCIVDLVEATCQSTVRNISKIEHISHDLIQIRRVGSNTVISVLVCNKLIGLMPQLGFDYILETKLIKGISLTDVNLSQPFMDLTLL